MPKVHFVGGQLAGEEATVPWAGLRQEHYHYEVVPVEVGAEGPDAMVTIRVETYQLVVLSTGGPPTPQAERFEYHYRGTAAG